MVVSRNFHKTSRKSTAHTIKLQMKTLIIFITCQYIHTFLRMCWIKQNLKKLHYIIYTQLKREIQNQNFQLHNLITRTCMYVSILNDNSDILNAYLLYICIHKKREVKNEGWQLKGMVRTPTIHTLYMYTYIRIMYGFYVHNIVYIKILDNIYYIYICMYM